MRPASSRLRAPRRRRRKGGAEFFKGKTVTYIVATAPGGGYDPYGRLVAEYMQKYLPGSTFVVKNMPGAGHLIGANAIYAAKPDGLTIGTFNTGLIYNQLIGLDGVKFDLTKMSWIGKAASDPRVIACAEHSPIKTFEDLRASKEPVKFATAGIGSASYVETVMLTNALRLPAKVLTGYNGNEDQLAMRRRRSTARSPRAPPTSSSSTTDTAASSPRSAAPTRTCRSWRRSSPTRPASS